MTEKPNIILIVLDTVRAEQLGLYGREQDPMPNLTAFAEDENSIVFDRAYTNAPWTLPAHASLFTGEVPSEHGCHGASPKFNPETKPLAVRLSEEGYHTIGISNNIWISEHFGFEKGFDTFYKQWQLFRESPDIGHIIKEEYESKKDLILELLQGNPLTNFANGLYGKYLYRRNDFGAARSTDDALSLVDKSESPFFLFINFMEAHAPYQEHECSTEFLPKNVSDTTKYTEMSSRSLDYHTGRLEISTEDFDALEGLYDGELRYLDSQLGRLFDGFDRQDLFEESIIVVVGDHGENIGDHDLMAHRFSMHDTLLRVPLVIWSPFSTTQNHDTSDSPVSLTDLFDFLLSVGTREEPHEFIPKEPVVSQYLSTSYTPESRDDEFDFEASRFNRRYNAIYKDDYKLVMDDSGHSQLYEYDGQELEQVEDSTLAGGLTRHSSFLSQNHSLQNGMSEAVEQQLEELGYL